MTSSLAISTDNLGRKQLPQIVSISNVGLEGFSAYIAHASGHWGPENKKSDYLKHKLIENQTKGQLEADISFLKIKEEFKIIVPLSNKETAEKIVKERKEKEVFDGGKREDGQPYDWDDKQKTLWLLSDDFPISNPGKWNRNNIYEVKA